jgi:hypothetical protein
MELSVDWKPQNTNIPFFVRPVQNLRKLHIIDYTQESAKYISPILDFLPTLECLSIFRQNSYNWSSPQRLTKNHLHLKEIVIWAKRLPGFECIKAISPVSNLMRWQQLPSLRLITMHGPFPGGCVDNSVVVLVGGHRQAWMQLISTCRENNVRLVNSSGDSMHLWTMRHGIVWKQETVGNAGSNTNSENDTRSSISSSSETSSSDEEHSSDEGEWAEVETDRPDNASEIGSSDTISNDSDDVAYRYVHQNDIDLVNSDSSELELETGY